MTGLYAPGPGALLLVRSELPSFCPLVYFGPEPTVVLISYCYGPGLNFYAVVVISALLELPTPQAGELLYLVPLGS